MRNLGGETGFGLLCRNSPGIDRGLGGFSRIGSAQLHSFRGIRGLFRRVCSNKKVAGLRASVSQPAMHWPTIRAGQSSQAPPWAGSVTGQLWAVPLRETQCLPTLASCVACVGLPWPGRVLSKSWSLASRPPRIPGARKASAGADPVGESGQKSSQENRQGGFLSQ
jgi:hypothetical protein